MALLFSGTGQYLSTSSALVTAAPMTFACWYKPATTSISQAQMAIGNNGSANFFGILSVATGNVERCETETAGVGSSATFGGALTIGSWVHIVGVITSSILRQIYINGVAGTANTTSSVPTVNITSIGASFLSASPSNLCNGSLAYPTIWDIALSPTDIAALYNAGAGVDPRTVQNASLASFTKLQVAAPFVDLVTTTTWTVTGSPTVVADPFALSVLPKPAAAVAATATISFHKVARPKPHGLVVTHAGATITGGTGVTVVSTFPTMQWITIGLSPVVLFMLPPNFATEIKVSLSVMDQAQVTQNNKSSTRSFTDKGRYTIEMECLCGNVQESTDVRMGLNRLKNEYVSLPLWVDNVVLTAQTTAGTSTATYSGAFPPARFGAFWIFIDLDTYIFEILSVTSVTGTTVTFSTPTVFTWPIGSILMPLIFGRFSVSNPPTFTKLTESVNTLAFTFEEKSPLSNAINPFPSSLATVQTNIGLSGPERLWNVPCTYSSSEADNVVVDIDYERIGFVREDAAYTYPQVPRRVTELSFELCTRKQIALIESIFIDRRGRTINMWVPTFRNDLDLIVATPGSNPSQVFINGNSRYLDTNFTTHPGYPYLCLNDNTGQAIFPFKISSIAGNVIFPIVPITQAFAVNAKISALILSRFQDAQIQWTYRSDGYAYTTIKWVEATEDYFSPPFQELVAQGYHFYNVNEAVNTHWWYTSFESTLVVPTLGTFIPGLFSHAEIKMGLDMGSDEADIVSFQFVGNPLSLLMPWTLVGDLNVDIFDINRISLTWDRLFSGTVEELNTEGAKITAKVLGFGGMYDQQFHRHVMAGDCPYAVYSPECGAGRSAANTVTVTITSISGNNIIVSPPVGGPGNVFANGLCQINGGPQVQFLHIVQNNSTSFQLSRPPVSTPIGSIATISLGCDGTSVQCEGFFNNLVNFGGEDNIPPTNPSVTAVATKDSSSTTSNK